MENYSASIKYYKTALGICKKLGDNVIDSIMIHQCIGNSFYKMQQYDEALIEYDLQTINSTIQRISLETFSWFDTSGKEPERFYHAFVLGMLVDLKASYVLESNRESGKGRYDILLIPKDVPAHPGIVIEFKSLDPQRGEKELADTAKAALEQIRSLSYAASLKARGVPEDRILTYGFAFKGKDVLVEGGKAC